MPVSQVEDFVDSHDFAEGMAEFSNYEHSQAIFQNEEDYSDVESSIPQGNPSGRYVPLWILLRM